MQNVLLLSCDANSQFLSPALQAGVIHKHDWISWRWNEGDWQDQEVSESSRATKSSHILLLNTGWVKIETGTGQACTREYRVAIWLHLKAACDHKFWSISTQTLCNICVSFSTQILGYSVPWKAAGDVKEFWMIFPSDFSPGYSGFLSFSLCQWFLSLQSSYVIIAWRHIYIYIYK